MILLRSLLPLLLGAGLSTAMAQADPPATLIESGQARGVIVLAEQPHESEVQAAELIQEHLKLMSGTDLPRATPGTLPPNLLPIYIGSCADPALDAVVRPSSGDPGAFAWRVARDAIHLRGLSPEGTYFASCDLLETLGVRWYFPGPLGTVTPRRSTVALVVGQTVQWPSFAARRTSSGRYRGKYPAEEQWCRRVRMGGPNFPSAHGIPLGKNVTIKTDPDLFALVGGQRRSKQLCVSNPRVLELAVEQTRAFFAKNPDSPWIGMGPNDGSGFCECPNCQALDSGEFDAFSNERGVTDRYIWFFNRVLEQIKDQHPTKKLGFYVYHSYMQPPVKVKPDPRIVPALAPIALCRIHGFDNPVCPEKTLQRALIERWSAICPEVYDRGYWFNLADPGLPFFMAHRLRRDIPLSHELGLDGWRVETLPAPAAQGPSLYLAARLMWNHRADVDALLADYHQNLFGPAAAPMAAYHDLLDTALRDADHHAGSAFDLPQIYPAEVRSRARALINQARQLAPEEPFAARVRLFDLGLEYLEQFVLMVESRQGHDYARSWSALQRLDALGAELTGMDPPMLNPWATRDYLGRFFRLPTEQGYARGGGDQRVLVKLSDQWQFALDPQGIGESVNWHQPVTRGGNWQTISSSRSWSEQGLRYYKGQAWYRQRFTLPADFAAPRVFAWFAGVDEKAMVYINGRAVGISHGSAFAPFELDAGDTLRPGDNLIAVRVLNQKVNELGTGGLIGPALLYVPARGADATPENIRELSPTFP
jgi:hypothetical protein